MKGRNPGCTIFLHLIGSLKVAARLDSEIIPTIHSKKNQWLTSSILGDIQVTEVEYLANKTQNF
jgi:hypothetical protein